MTCPGKTSKKSFQNRFSEPFWPPKPFQNRRKINQKRCHKKHPKKARKIFPDRPRKKTVLAKEREARKCVGVVETRKSICDDMSRKTFVMRRPSKAQHSPEKLSKTQYLQQSLRKPQQSLAKAKPKKALVMTRPGKHS